MQEDSVEMVIHDADGTECDEPDDLSPDDDICAHGYRIHREYR